MNFEDFSASEKEMRHLNQSCQELKMLPGYARRCQAVLTYRFPGCFSAASAARLIDAAAQPLERRLQGTSSTTKKGGIASGTAPPAEARLLALRGPPRYPDAVSLGAAVWTLVGNAPAP